MPKHHVAAIKTSLILGRSDILAILFDSRCNLTQMACCGRTMPRWRQVNAVRLFAALRELNFDCFHAPSPQQTPNLSDVRSILGGADPFSRVVTFQLFDQNQLRASRN